MLAFGDYCTGGHKPGAGRGWLNAVGMVPFP